jgi:uncharacterized protein (UPF0333 family)
VAQPACQQFSASDLIDCGNSSVSAAWTVPNVAVSRVYIAHLVNNVSPAVDSHITFVVRDDSSHSDIPVQTSVETCRPTTPTAGTASTSVKSRACRATRRRTRRRTGFL